MSKKETKKEKKPGSNSEVGYGRPPLHTRFRKGQSGNPTGKRRVDEVERIKKLILKEADRRLTVREGDKVTKMPALQAVIRGQINSAAKGNTAAARAVIKTVQEIEAEARLRRTASADRKLNSPNEMTDEELLAVIAEAQDGEQS